MVQVGQQTTESCIVLMKIEQNKTWVVHTFSPIINLIITHLVLDLAVTQDWFLLFLQLFLHYPYMIPSIEISVYPWLLWSLSVFS